MLTTDTDLAHCEGCFTRSKIFQCINARGHMWALSQGCSSELQRVFMGTQVTDPTMWE